MTTPKLTLSKLATVVGDDRLSFKGDMVLPYPFTPHLYPGGNGARFVIRKAGGGTLLDVTLPAGFYDSITHIGWIGASSGTWTYKNPGGVQSITKMVLKPSGISGLLRTTVVGKNGSYAVAPADLPLHGIVVVDSPTAETGQCGEASFPGLPGPTCTFNSSHSTVHCK